MTRTKMIQWKFNDVIPNDQICNALPNETMTDDRVLVYNARPHDTILGHCNPFYSVRIHGMIHVNKILAVLVIHKGTLKVCVLPMVDDFQNDDPE